MTRLEFEKWRNENGKSSVNKYANGIDYVFVKMKDDWIAIFEYNYLCGDNEYQPLIQAKDEKHAESFVAMRERANVTINKLC